MCLTLKELIQVCDFSIKGFIERMLKVGSQKVLPRIVHRLDLRSIISLKKSPRRVLGLN